MTAAHYQLSGRTAVITFDHPPVNTLAHGLRAGIVAGLDRANADSMVDAIVITGSTRAFSGGADVREFGTTKVTEEPRLGTVIRAIENSPKPVIAAIAGVCLGGGLELALSAHFRVARPDAELGLPEVKLGLLPGAGGTQRLPRLANLETALNMIVSGDKLPARELQGSVVDRVVEGNLIEGALEFAAKVVTEKTPLRRARDLKVDYPAAEAYLQFARTTVAARSRHLPAPRKCVEAVAVAVTKPFDEGLQFEREAFQALLATPESQALRHAFAAEHAAARIPGLPEDIAPRPVRRVGVIGGGTMGVGIAMTFANAGVPVVLLEVDQERLDRGLQAIRNNYEGSRKKGKLTQAAVDERLGLITPTLQYDALADVDLVVEAVFESMEVKEQVFKALDGVARSGAILASNTSALDLDRIAAFTRRPQDVIGLHFFSPAHVMRLLEVVRGARTAPDVLATCMQLARRIGKIAVVAGVCDGFIGNRMLARYLEAANALVEQGALPEQVDRALEGFGMAMGPFRMGDLAGLDIGWAKRKRLAAEHPQRAVRVIADLLCEAGRFGQKTGAGWYRYEAGRRDAIPDPAVRALVERFRAERGLAARKISDDEVVDRCMRALAQEGARILEEGIALRASDIDVVYLNGYGFPRHRGGPMFHAQANGLAVAVREPAMNKESQ